MWQLPPTSSPVLGTFVSLYQQLLFSGFRASYNFSSFRVIWQLPPPTSLFKGHGSAATSYFPSFGPLCHLRPKSSPVRVMCQLPKSTSPVLGPCASCHHLLLLFGGLRHLPPPTSPVIGPFVSCHLQLLPFGNQVSAASLNFSCFRAMCQHPLSNFFCFRAVCQLPPSTSSVLRPCVSCHLQLPPEWPHRQGGCLACWSCKIDSRLSWDWTDLNHSRGVQGVLPMRVGIRPVNWIYRLWRHCL